MRGILVSLAVVFSFMIVIALVHQKPSEPQQIAFISTESPAPAQIEQKANIETPPPASVQVPEPLVIKSYREVNLIPDESLRNFVRRKADFRHDNVLFFEWKGIPGDKMTGEASDKKYIITLHPARTVMVGQEVVHRQIFVIPATYSYVCEVAK